MGLLGGSAACSSSGGRGRRYVDVEPAGALAHAVLVDRLYPVGVGGVGLYGVVGVGGRSAARVRRQLTELAPFVVLADAPQDHVARNAFVIRVIPSKRYGVLGDLCGKPRGLGRYGALLGVGRPDQEGKQADGQSQGGHEAQQGREGRSGVGPHERAPAESEGHKSGGGADRGRYFRAILMTLISDGARSMIFEPENSALARSQGPEEPCARLLQIPRFRS